jgi:hypothetical protein
VRHFVDSLDAGARLTYAGVGLAERLGPRLRDEASPAVVDLQQVGANDCLVVPGSIQGIVVADHLTHVL